MTAQVEPLETFSDHEEVILKSLNVQLDSSGYKAAAKGELHPEKITVLLEGRDASVVSLQAELAGTWKVVLYFDQQVLDTHTLRWAARLLAEHCRELTELGPVEVVIADPNPRSLGKISSNPEVIDQILSHLAVQGEGEDRLNSHRRNLPRTENSEKGPKDLTLWSRMEEERILQRQLDQWLLHLNSFPRQGSPGVLFYVSSGFETDLSLFYGPSSATAPPSALTETLEAIAAYGWTIFPLLPEDSKTYLKSGFTIGPWRFRGFRSLNEGGAWLLSHEEDRDPKRAEAFLELGRIHFESGNYSSAEDSLKQAIFHFAQDQKTASREVEALILLAKSLLALEKEQEAWRALEKALDIQPELAESQFPFYGSLENPWKGLEKLAGWTTGFLVRDRGDLERALYALHHQITVAYQVAGGPRGVAIETTVSIQERPFSIEGSTWSRSGIPLEIAKARLRNLLGGESESEDFILKMTPGENGTRMAISALQSIPLESRWIRVTVADGGDSIWRNIQVLPPMVWTPQEPILQISLPQHDQEDGSWRILLVEDLFSEMWATIFLDY